VYQILSMSLFEKYILSFLQLAQGSVLGVFLNFGPFSSVLINDNDKKSEHVHVSSFVDECRLLVLSMNNSKTIL